MVDAMTIQQRKTFYGAIGAMETILIIEDYDISI